MKIKKTEQKGGIFGAILGAVIGGLLIPGAGIGIAAGLSSGAAGATVLSYTGLAVGGIAGGLLTGGSSGNSSGASCPPGSTQCASQSQPSSAEQAAAALANDPQYCTALVQNMATISDAMKKVQTDMKVATLDLTSSEAILARLANNSATSSDAATTPWANVSNDNDNFAISVYPNSVSANGQFTISYTIKSPSTSKYSLALLSNGQPLTTIVDSEALTSSGRPISLQKSLVMSSALAVGQYELLVVDPDNTNKAAKTPINVISQAQANINTGNSTNLQYNNGNYSNSNGTYYTNSTSYNTGYNNGYTPNSFATQVNGNTTNTNVSTTGYNTNQYQTPQYSNPANLNTNTYGATSAPVNGILFTKPFNYAIMQRKTTIPVGWVYQGSDNSPINIFASAKCVKNVHICTSDDPANPNGNSCTLIKSSCTAGKTKTIPIAVNVNIADQSVLWKIPASLVDKQVTIYAEQNGQKIGAGKPFYVSY